MAVVRLHDFKFELSEANIGTRATLYADHTTVNACCQAHMKAFLGLDYPIPSKLQNDSFNVDIHPRV
jgi:hypothetical protein